MSIKSLVEARAVLARRAPGLRISRREDEYRVWNAAIPRDRQEPTAYYANDLTDAVNTAIAMHEKGAW